MPLPISIDDLINQRVVENARIEYKADWNPEPILHTICAFANDIDNWGGGYIIVGVEERDGLPRLPVKGLSKSSIDRIQKELLPFSVQWKRMVRKSQSLKLTRSGLISP